MTWWPRSFAGRLCLAFVASTCGVSLLQVCAARADAARAQIAAATPTAPKRPGLGFRLLPSSGTILLATRLDAIAPDVAPVVQIFADGNLALRRPARLPQAPVRTSPPNRDGQGAAILLPAGSLGQLTSSARGSLVEMLGQLIAERPVPARRLVAVDFALSARELSALLPWIP